ncbi:hypothetical protein DL770_001884 [Monosporascus sp. CRB-9-2]|nr:hypothetical protein DL770_001884 [Monosporascus sp. CRB-9-2]
MDPVALLKGFTKEVTTESEEEHPAAAGGLIDDTSDFSENKSIDEHSPASSRPRKKRKRTCRTSLAQNQGLHPNASYVLPPGEDLTRFPTTHHGLPPTRCAYPIARRGPTTPWAAAIYDQPTPPPPFPFPSLNELEKSSSCGFPRPTTCSSHTALAPSANKTHNAVVGRRRLRPTCPTAGGGPLQALPTSPGADAALRLARARAASSATTGPACEFGLRSGTGVAPGHPMPRTDGGADELMPDTAGAGTWVGRHFGEEMGTGSDGQWAGSGWKSANANAY